MGRRAGGGFEPCRRMPWGALHQGWQIILRTGTSLRVPHYGKGHRGVAAVVPAGLALLAPASPVGPPRGGPPGFHGSLVGPHVSASPSAGRQQWGADGVGGSGFCGGFSGFGLGVVLGVDIAAALETDPGLLPMQEEFPNTPTELVDSFRRAEDGFFGRDEHGGYPNVGAISTSRAYVYPVGSPALTVEAHPCVLRVPSAMARCSAAARRWCSAVVGSPQA